MHRITVTNTGKDFLVPSGTLLLDALRSAGIYLDAPCGGMGTCGKCKVTVTSAEDSGLYPACRFSVTQDIHVLLPSQGKQTSILETGGLDVSSHDPVLGIANASIPKCMAEEVPSNCYALAFDMGTTTLVCYLLDVQTGDQACVSSMLNPQTSYGADVVSRCIYASKDEKGTLTQLLRQALNELAQENVQKAGISQESIYFAALVGNTCMHHLCLGISTQSLIHPPYTAAVNELQMVSAQELGLWIHPQAMAAVLPPIAGFVGSDTVGVLLSLPPDTFQRLTLVLDIGTNGELVLGKDDVRWTCSTAAGPAFEGAKITCGMRGAAGAIDHVRLNGLELEYSVIGSVPPIGICGSGLLDLVCCLLDLGIVSSTGRLLPPHKWPSPAAKRYQDRWVNKNGAYAFLTANDQVYLTQKDIREIQLAKAAISAGITLMCRQMDVSVSDIQSVLLSGAFGSYLSPESACRIGMIPSQLARRIHVIGNAAGEGAKLAAKSRSALAQSSQLARTTHFLELASSPDFQKIYLSSIDLL